MGMFRRIGHSVVTVAGVFAIVISAFAAAYPQMELGEEPLRSVRLTDTSRIIFRFQLSRDEVARIEVVHRSTTAYLKVLSPSGRTVITKVAPTLWNGTTDVLFRGSESGFHRLIITTDRPGKTSGEIDVRMAERRPFMPQDQETLRAHASLSRADTLRAYLLDLDAVRIKREEAEKEYRNAIELFTYVGDRRSLAGAHLRYGEFLYDEFERFEDSEVHLREAAAIYDRAGDRSGSALARIARLLPILFSRGQVPEARRLADEARTLLIELNDPALSGRLDMSEGRMALNSGLPLRALELLRRQVDTAGEIDIEGRLWAESHLLSVAQATGDSRLQNATLNGVIHTLESKKGQIHARHLITPLFLRAQDFLLANRLAAATSGYKTVLIICEKLGLPKKFAYFLREIGQIHLELKEYSKARPYLLRSLELYEKFSPFQAQAIYNAIGVLYLRIGEPLKAKEFFDRAVVRNRTNGDRYAEANSLANRARAELALGNLLSALESIDSANILGQGHLDHLYTRSSRQAFNAIVLRTFSEIKIDILHQLFRNSGDIGYLEAAFEAQERTNARSLLEIVHSSGFEAASSIDTGLLASKNEVLKKLSELEFRSRMSKENHEFEMNRLLLGYEEIENRIRKLNPLSEALSNPPAVTLADARALLDPESALIAYSIGEDASHALLVTGEGVHAFNLPRREIVDAAVERFLESLDIGTPRPVRRRRVKGLSDMVMGPMLEKLSGKKRLLIVSQGALRRIPFNAVEINTSEGTGPLVKTFETVSLPSVSTLVGLRQINRTGTSRGWNRLIALIADPVFEPTDERLPKTAGEKRGRDVSSMRNGKEPGPAAVALTRLPFSNVEARRIAGMTDGRATIVSGTAASRERIVDGELSDYRVLHFATHGFINEQYPELSGIALSLYDDEGLPKNGFLRTVDLHSLKLNADLVVLSGCKTAAGGIVRGEGIIGMTRAFMYAGVPTVIASLWDVEDAATSYFMENFYDALLRKGLPPGAALRHAQLKFLTSPRFSAPKHWAGFVVHGEYDVYFK